MPQDDGALHRRHEGNAGKTKKEERGGRHRYAQQQHRERANHHDAPPRFAHPLPEHESDDRARGVGDEQQQRLGDEKQADGDNERA